MKTKGNRLFSRVLAGFTFAALLMPTFAFAQEKNEKEQKRQEKQQKKESKQADKDEKRIDKNVRKYEEARTKAFDKYGKDFEFKEEVEFEYRRIQREHSKLAFETNITDSGDEVLTHTGDKVPRGEDTLYDNLLAQDYVNRVGQSLVPSESEKRYGFKVTLNPMPDARSLSTGTVYVSTGLLSLVDNEAQLAYILSHEIAHIEKNHWKEDVLVAKWIEAATESQQRKASIFGAIAGAALGGFAGGGNSAFFGAFAGSGVAQNMAKLIDRKAFVWALAQEDESDKLALDYMLKRNYDVREVANFYESLKTVAIEDPRIELNSFADRSRTEERRTAVNNWVNSVPTSQLSSTLLGAVNLRGKSLSIDRNTTAVVSRVQKNEAKMADDVKAKLQNGDILAGDGEFENIMATLKRDNGVVAFYYDMYKLAARNLSQSLAIRSDDALGYFYYGKVLKLTARIPGEKEEAMQMFAKAIELDRRGAIPQSRLYYALTKMSGRTTNNIKEVSADLKQYVDMYQRMNAGLLPPNMSVVYDYLQEAGESDWTAVPVTNVKTVNSSTTATAPTTISKPAATTTKPTSNRRP